jgi:hypothetical protein
MACTTFGSRSSFSLLASFCSSWRSISACSSCLLRRFLLRHRRSGALQFFVQLQHGDFFPVDAGQRLARLLFAAALSPQALSAVAAAITRPAHTSLRVAADALAI